MGAGTRHGLRMAAKGTTLQATWHFLTLPPFTSVSPCLALVLARAGVWAGLSATFCSLSSKAIGLHCVESVNSESHSTLLQKAIFAGNLRAAARMWFAASVYLKPGRSIP
jgi:hypothetical protein